MAEAAMQDAILLIRRKLGVIILFNMQLVKPGVQTSDLLITWWPTLPPDLQPPSYTCEEHVHCLAQKKFGEIKP